MNGCPASPFLGGIGSTLRGTKLGVLSGETVELLLQSDLLLFRIMLRKKERQSGILVRHGEWLLVGCCTLGVVVAVNGSN